MKATELLKKFPQSNLVWNLNEDSGVFWTELTIMEDNGFMDPWGQRFNLRNAKRIPNGAGDTVEFRIASEFQGYPIELSIMNE
jgi:hypothetical protein